MVDCVTDERLNGIINADNPYQTWLNHLESCCPGEAVNAAILGIAGANVRIHQNRYKLTDEDYRYNILENDTDFVLEVALTQEQAEAICNALGWIIV